MAIIGDIVRNSGNEGLIKAYEENGAFIEAVAESYINGNNTIQALEKDPKARKSLPDNFRFTTGGIAEGGLIVGYTYIDLEGGTKYQAMTLGLRVGGHGGGVIGARQENEKLLAQEGRAESFFAVYSGIVGFQFCILWRGEEVLAFFFGANAGLDIGGYFGVNGYFYK